MAIRILYTLGLLPVLIQAKIYVEILPGDTIGRSSVDYFGNIIEVINNVERNSFRLSDGNLKTGVRNFHGGNPDNAYLHDPTRFGNQYAINNWRPTTATLAPVRANIVSFNVVPVAFLTQTFTNDHPNISATFNVELRQQIEERVTSTWTSSVETNRDRSISFNIFGIGGGFGRSFTTSVGQSTENSQLTTIGTSAGLEVVVEPGQSLTAELVASRGTMRVEIDYETTLVGRVFASYGSRHKGSFFWALDVNQVMAAAGLPRTVMARNAVNVGFFSEGSVRIFDNRSRRTVAVFPIEVKRSN